MSIQRTAVGLTLAAAAAVTLSVRADQPVNLNVEMGLWEVSAHARTSGTFPPDVQQRLQSLPPEQREKIMAAMQGVMADAQRGHVFRECMTPERLAQGFGRDEQSSQCKSSLVRNTRSDFEYHKVCKSDDGTSHTENAVFHMTDRHHVTGTVDVVASEGGHPMTIHQVIDGKWVASSCGSVKDVEVVK
ncbi:MAG TPA: DUF3617 domain-containing protein [Steroidobacteraceae bacterium]|nr:DUF3617 domain-containing protein [Steroidobacteraceae bacterium]